uniref:Protein FAR1-RELATED SEQUENCE n=1 Tax=Lactuca sativa TaxID=4236 RepID=A0A9R1WMH8_LACSA|nr:hypothetical protein LSAT_V11C100034840 [Lactuca sativa]
MLHMITFLLVAHIIGFLCDDIKPKINSTYDSYGVAITMYKNFALEAGFDVRLGTIKTTKSDIITQRHLLYSREGKPKSTKVDTLNPHVIRFKEGKTHLGKLVFILIHGTQNYIVDDVVEQHTHELFGKGNMCFSRTKRNPDYSLEMFTHNLSKKNIGASRAQRLYTGFQGGPSIRGGLVFDFKNSTRNLNSYIGCTDTKFLVVNTMERKKNIPTFCFEFRVVQKKLNALFWADETAKYDMVFVLFIRIDNHKKCVDFGVVLLSREDGSSYSWLVRAILKAFKKTLLPTQQLMVHSSVAACILNMSVFCVCKYYVFLSFILHNRYFSYSFVDSNSAMTTIEIFSTVNLHEYPVHEMPSRESFYNQILCVESLNDVSDIENPSDIHIRELEVVVRD